MTLIKGVDFHCQSNNTAHRTIEITTTQLVVRRGQSFVLTLEVMQPFSPGDVLVLTVETGPAPSEKRGTRSEFGNPAPMYASDVKAVWKYSMEKCAVGQGGLVTLSVTPPADAPVGKYSLSARTAREKIRLGTVVVLFNPWCSEDWVYLPDARERDEYVMNENGVVFIGSAHYISKMHWVFGQFEEEMVDICFKLLDVNPKHRRDPADDVSARCNPIYISRVVSAMINSSGDQGVLSGNWSKDFSGGRSPTSWTSSVSILQQWYDSHCQPVKYGQCWVFAAVMCTVMRFLGIPCRVVTNFQSAHDTNCSLTIDEYYDYTGVRPKKASDSIWNFHVWVEAWMKRPDLMKGDTYDGWQVLDPTPQELSDGVHCCGPAPVSAILRGDTDLKYDLPFVFAEVNADVVKWMIRPDGSKKRMHSDTRVVGQNISTKTVGSWMRSDITNCYKHREGSSLERSVFNRAVNRVNSRDGQQGDTGEEQLKLEMKIEEEPMVQNGDDIKLKLSLCNKDPTNRKMLVHVNGQAMTYHGIPACSILNCVQEETLTYGKGVTIPIHIPFSAYCKSMKGCDSMKVSVMALDDDDVYETETDIVLSDPPITMEVLGPVHVGHMMAMEVTFKNPRNEKLENCQLTVTGAGLFKPWSIRSDIRDLEPYKTLTLTITTIPYKVGVRTVVADFDCSAFRDLKGSCTVEVKP